MVKLISEDEFLSQIHKVRLQKLSWDLASQKGIDVWMRRDDLIDEYLSGNKFYKLFYNLQAAKNSGYQKLLSFGGAHSNHIFALASAAKRYGFKAVGVIRGERPKFLSPMLQDAERWGMQLHFVSRADYQTKDRVGIHINLTNLYGDFFEIPEGAANEYGALGAKVLGEAICQQVGSDYSSVCLACGTGNTLAGVAAGLMTNAPFQEESVIGFSVLKGEGNLGEQVLNYQHALNVKANNWRLISGYHGGGYAKKLPDYLRRFMIEFERESNISLDPVYTVKMCWGVAQLIAQNYWPRGSRLILIHTGGLQGRRGFGLT